MRRSKAMRVGGAGAVVVVIAAAPASAQLRVAQWNITNYSATSTSRDPDFRTALYATAPNGLRMAPDILVVQEIVQGGSGNTASHQATGQASVNAFLANLNGAAGSPGDWAAVPYLANGGDTGNAMFYRTSKVAVMGATVLTANTGTGPTQAPRDTARWQVRLVGYSVMPGAAGQLYLYGAHFKAGSTTADQDRRTPEGRRIRQDSNTLPDNTNFVVCADMNVQTSSQTFYQYMVSVDTTPAPGEEFLADASGQFFDPINSAGSWENSGTYRNIHTQEPATSMDSRHDQILIAANLRDGQGMDYMPAVPGGNILATFSQYVSASNPGTWNDPNHSYRCWGNDGGSFNVPLRTTGNTMVGPTIAAALVNSVAGNGHLPVYLDLQVPAKIAAPATIDFGSVAQGGTAQVTIQISNAVNVALWSRDGSGRGIDTLNYTLTPSAGFTTPAGPFTDGPGGGVNSHIISMNTSTAGPKSGTLTVVSDDPDTPTLVIPITGNVVGATPNYDVNGDGLVDIDDLYAWVASNTDVNADGTINAADGAALRTRLRQGEVADMTAGRR